MFLFAQLLIIVEHRSYKVDVQVLVDKDERHGEDQKPNEEEVSSPFNDKHDQVEARCTEHDPQQY